MAEDNVREQPKQVMIDPTYRTNRKRIEDDEKELEELMKGTVPEDTPEDTLEDTPEAEDTTTVVAEDTPEDKELSKEEATFKKRYGDLRRHQQEKEKEWADKLKDLEDGPTGAIAPPRSDEDIEAWATKYPDIAGIVETIATKKAQEMFDKTNTRFKELDDLNFEAKRGKAEGAIRVSHPDFDALKGSDEFHDWADGQSDWIKNALYDNQDDSKSVIRILDLYKMDKGLTPAAKKANAKDAASDVKSKRSAPSIDADGEGKRFSESQIKKESDAWFEKNYGKIIESQRTGNFVYDLS